MHAIGAMPMPADFRYRDVYYKGKPKHTRYDAFGARHPKMENGQRAKIFAPFDALRGFSDALGRQDVPYVEKAVLEEDDQKRLDSQLKVLAEKTRNGREARKNRVRVKVTYFVPCTDIDNEAYGKKGQYRTLEGVCLAVEAQAMKALRVEDTWVEFSDILKIEGEDLPDGDEGEEAESPCAPDSM